MNIRKTIQNEMKRQNITRYRLSVLSGIDQGRLSRFEKGFNLRSDAIEKICNALKLELKPK